MSTTIVVLVENEVRQVGGLFQATMIAEESEVLTTSPSGVAFPAVFNPMAIFVGPTSEHGAMEDLFRDYPALRERVTCADDAYADEQALYRRLNRIVEIARKEGREVLVLWDNQLDTPWARRKESDGTTLSFVSEWSTSLSEAERDSTRIVVVSAYKGYEPHQFEELDRMKGSGEIDEFRDRRDIDLVIADELAELTGSSLKFEARVHGKDVSGPATPEMIRNIERKMERHAKKLLTQIAAGEVEPGVNGTANPAFVGPISINAATGVIKLFEHRDRSAWAQEAGWDLPDKDNGQRRPVSQVMPEITDRTMRALIEGGVEEVEKWGWRELEIVDIGLDFGSRGADFFLYILRKGTKASTRELIKMNVAPSTGVNTYASRNRSAIARPEILQSANNGYICGRDYIRVHR